MFSTSLLGAYHCIWEFGEEEWVRRECSQVALHGRLLWHRQLEAQARLRQHLPVEHKVSCGLFNWLLQTPLSSLMCLSVCTDDFCKKALSNVTVTWDAYLHYGLVLWYVKFAIKCLVPKNLTLTRTDILGLCTNLHSHLQVKTHMEYLHEDHSYLHLWWVF